MRKAIIYVRILTKEKKEEGYPNSSSKEYA